MRAKIDAQAEPVPVQQRTMAWRDVFHLVLGHAGGRPAQAAVQRGRATEARTAGSSARGCGLGNARVGVDQRVHPRTGLRLTVAPRGAPTL